MSSTKSNRVMKMIVVVAFFLAAFTNNGIAHASEITSSKMVELTNKSRSEAGLNPLTFNVKLALAAQKKAAHMFANQYFEHVSPDGVTPWHWFDVAGYDYIYAAENLAIDFTTAEGAHSAFMKSTGHRENILCASYKEVGIAVVSGKFNGKDSIIIVEEFGTSRNYSSGADPFFETSKNAEAAAEVATVPVYATGIAQSSDKSAEYANNSKSQGKYGKVIPQAYSIRDSRHLKKVYVEDIHWKRAEADRLCYQYLTYGKARLKYTLRKLTNGQCCTPLSK